MCTVSEVKMVFPDAEIDALETCAKICCPYHNEHTPSFIILLKDKGNLKAGFCKCFGCGKATSFKAMCKDLGYVIDDNPISRTQRLKLQLQEREQQPNTFHLCDPPMYKKDIPYNFSPYIKSRGIGEDIQRKFKIFEKTDECKVYMPVFAEDGKYLYFNARSTKEKAFFIEPGAEKCLAYIEEIDFSKPIAICESQIDAMSLWQLGMQAVATLGASNINALRPLLKSTSVFILAFDSDVAGIKATQEATKALGTYRCVKLNWTPDFKDVNEALQELGEELCKGYLNDITG